MTEEQALLSKVQLEVLDREFQPIPFDIESQEWPLAEMIGLRGPLATFQSQFDCRYPLDVGLARDVEFLRQLELDDCYYGAGSYRIYPFVCGSPLSCSRDSERRWLRRLFRARREGPTGQDIVSAVKARHFRSEHIKKLAKTYIPFPGYHPDTDNDEVHNDFDGQYIFSHEEGVDEFAGAHGALKRYAADGRLWYVLTHTNPQLYGEFLISHQVILFALGHSPCGSRLVGVVTHQACHNLCD